MFNFYHNEDGQGFCQMERNCVNGIGKYENVAFVVKTLCEIEGVELRKEGTNVVKYAVLMDGETLNRFADKLTAVEMFLDFTGVKPSKRKALKAQLMA